LTTTVPHVLADGRLRALVRRFVAAPFPRRYYVG
jgi:hypothetical protein